MATLFNTKIKDTYQSLLKLEDNTILTTTTKNVTDGLGNASPLYMSTTRVGIGTNAPISTLNVLGLSTFIGASGNILGSTTANAAAQFYQSGFNGVLAIGGYSNGGGEIQSYQGGGANAAGSMFLQRQAGNVLIGSASDTAKLSVKGSGSTSATTSLLVQNSGGNAALTVRDDLYVFGGSRVYSTGNMYMDGNSGTLFSAWGQLNLQGASYVQIMNDTLRVGSQNFNFINTSFSPNNSTNSNLILSGNGSSFTNAGAGSTSVGNVLSIPIGLSTSTGNVTLNHINIDGVINTTAGTTLQRGFYYNPTLTGTVGFTHRAIETVTGNVLLGTTSGNVGIGTSNPTNKLEVVGTGRISSTLNVGGDGSTSTSFSSGFIAYDTGNAYGHSLVHAQSAQLYLFANPQGFAAGGYEPSSGGLSSGNLAFMTASTTRLKILNNGNVLIGTTTDSGYKLDINGNVRIQNTLNFNSNFEISSSGVVCGISRAPGNGPGMVFTDNMQQGQISFKFASPYSSPGTKGFLSASGRSVFNINIGLGNPNTSNLDASVLLLDGAHNVTFGTGTTIRGIYYNPTITSLTGVVAHRAIETTSGDVVFNGGNVGVGEASPTARLQVKGSGSTSATTSLRIQNAGGVDVLKVTDDMYVTIQNTNSTECFQLLGFNSDASIKFTPSGGNSRIVLKSQSSSLILGTVANDWADVLTTSGAQTLRIGTLTPAGGGVNYYASQNGAAGYHKWFLNGVQNAQLTGAQFVLDDSGTVTPNASSILQANSTSKGFLPPRMTNAQRAAITSPAIGLMVYCTDAVEGIYVYKSTGWTFVA